METIIIFVLTILNVLWVISYFKQQRLNRVLLHLLYNFPDKEFVLDHMYVNDVLKIRKDMNRMINVDIDTSSLEKALRK